MSASAPLTSRQVFETLNAISRTRALSEAESLALERAQLAIEQLACAGERAKPRAWQDHELEAVRLALRRRGPGRPRTGDESLAQVLAAALGRTPEAVAQCMKRLRRDDRDQLPLELTS